MRNLSELFFPLGVLSTRPLVCRWPVATTVQAEGAPFDADTAVAEAGNFSAVKWINCLLSILNRKSFSKTKILESSDSVISVCISF